MADVADGLKPANENPWYVLMTLYGEEGPYLGPDNREKNRKAWNAWACQNLDEPTKAKISEETGLDIKELSGWTALESEIRDQFRKAFPARSGAEVGEKGLPNSNDEIVLNGTIFEAPIELNNYVFACDIALANSVFENRVEIRSSFFRCDAIFTNAKFQRDLNFNGSIIRGESQFESAKFDGHALFESADFWKTVRFNSAEFTLKTWFQHAEFHTVAFFNNAIFTEDTMFNGATFKREAHFHNVKFHSDTLFSEAFFAGKTSFENANIGGIGFFDHVKFLQNVTFAKAIFSGFINFQETQFGHVEANTAWPPIFADCQFEKPTSFRNAIFVRNYPDLTGAVLHEKTSFSADDARWPSKCDQPAKHAKDSCAIIRHVMAKQGLPEDEHFFFRREMQLAGQMEDWHWFRKLPIWFFGWISDYGNSIELPARWLTVLIVALSGFFAANLNSGENSIWWLDMLTGLGVSFSNTFRFFGFQKLFYGGYFTDELPPWIEVLSGGQTIVGYTLLFFLGLGLRQRFRLR